MNTSSIENQTKFIVVEWEANGYDDSDGDVLVYNKETKTIEHNFWTTRGYCPCSVFSDTYPSVIKGIKAGVITEEEVVDAMWNDEQEFAQGKYISINLDAFYEKNFVTPHVPVKVDGGRMWKGEGILYRLERVAKRDPWGRDRSSYYAYVYDPKDKSLNKTRMVYLSTTTPMFDYKKMFRDNLTLEIACRYVRCKNSQFSGHYCFATMIIDTLVPLINKEMGEFEIEIDNSKKLSGATKAAAKRAAEFITEKKEALYAWVATVEDFKNYSQEQKDEVVMKVIRRRYADKLEKAQLLN